MVLRGRERGPNGTLGALCKVYTSSDEVLSTDLTVKIRFLHLNLHKNRIFIDKDAI